MVSGHLNRPACNTPYLVGRDGVEPSQSQTGDLQSLGLATCSASPHSLLILYHALGAKVKGLFKKRLVAGAGVEPTTAGL